MDNAGKSLQYTADGILCFFIITYYDKTIINMHINRDFYEKKIIFSQLNGSHLEFEGFSYLIKCTCKLLHVIDHNSATIKQYDA